ncbi:hypothetical protein BKA82DRAFT_4016982 [Pisolithus tinctorius]|nr:hypothetical protein BKA82DRAFT_4016982 [Pisolithus tinctorius]
MTTPRQWTIIKVEAKVTIGTIPYISRNPAPVGGRAYVRTQWIIAVRVFRIGTRGGGGDGNIGNLASRDGFIEGVKSSLGHVLHGSRIGEPFGPFWWWACDAVVPTCPPEEGTDWVIVRLLPSVGRKLRVNGVVILTRDIERLDRRGCEGTANTGIPRALPKQRMRARRHYGIVWVLEKEGYGLKTKANQHHNWIDLKANDTPPK